MHAYTSWLAQVMPGEAGQVEAWLTEQRDRFIALCPAGTTNPGRLASNVAQNRLAFWTMGRWLVSVGAWSEAELEERREYDEHGRLAGGAHRQGEGRAYLTATALWTGRDGSWTGSEGRYNRSSAGVTANGSTLPTCLTGGEMVPAMGGVSFSWRAIEDQMLDDGLLNTTRRRSYRRATKVIRGAGAAKTVHVLKMYASALEEEPPQKCRKSCHFDGGQMQGLAVTKLPSLRVGVCIQ